MTSNMIIMMSLDDLRAVIREENASIIAKITDRPITRADAAKILKCTPQAIDQKVKRGELSRLPGEGHPRFSFNEVSGLRKYL